MTDLKLFGFSYQRAAKDHKCWLCGDPIPKGTAYFRTAGTLDGRMFSVKHCRNKCECTAEMLDQNPHLAPAVFSPTFTQWKSEQ